MSARMTAQDTGQTQVQLDDHWRILRSRWTTILLAGLVGLGFAAVYGVAWPPTHEATIGGGGDVPDGPGDPPPPPPDNAVEAYPGMPQPGTVLFGSSLPGNEDPWERHERYSGDRVGVHRMYFRWDQRTSYMIRLAQDDARLGRVPWVSVKNADWVGTGRGNRDGEIDQMLRALDGIDGPIWLTVSHEPEGGEGSNSPDETGGASAHLAMNRRVRQRMNALGVDNVALAPILMAWSWDSRSGRNPNEWWDSSVYDFVGVDTYDRRAEGMFSPYWYDVRSWAARKGVDVAVAEWGLEGSGSTSASRLTEWYEGAINSHRDGDGARVVALAAYDSPTGGWVLEGEQLRRFREFVGDPRSANP